MQVRIEKVVNCDWSILYTLILFATTTLVNEAFFITGRVVTCPTMTGVTGEIFVSNKISTKDHIFLEISTKEYLSKLEFKLKTIFPLEISTKEYF